MSDTRKLKVQTAEEAAADAALLAGYQWENPTEFTAKKSLLKELQDCESEFKDNNSERSDKETALNKFNEALKKAKRFLELTPVVLGMNDPRQEEYKTAVQKCGQLKEELDRTAQPVKDEVVERMNQQREIEYGDRDYCCIALLKKFFICNCNCNTTQTNAKSEIKYIAPEINDIPVKPTSVQPSSMIRS